MFIRIINKIKEKYKTTITLKKYGFMFWTVDDKEPKVGGWKYNYLNEEALTVDCYDFISNRLSYNKVLEDNKGNSYPMQNILKFKPVLSDEVEICSYSKHIHKIWFTEDEINKFKSKEK